MKRNKATKLNWRIVAGAFVSVAAIVFLYLQRDTIKKSIEALQSANWFFVAMAVIVYAGTVVAAAGIIWNLKLISTMTYRSIVLVQTATLFLGRITPASIGGLAAMGRVLFTQGHSVVQAGTVVGAGGIATFLGNVLLSIVAFILAFNTIKLSTLSIPPFILYAGAALLAAGCIALVFPKIRAKVYKVYKDVIKTLAYYTHKKHVVVYAVLLGALVTFCFALTLMLVAQSLGVHMSLFVAIITISLGSLGVAVTPLPGGVVGAEAALAATMVQFGIAPDIALAIAFVYRFVVFWLPLLPGYIASQYSLKKELL